MAKPDPLTATDAPRPHHRLSVQGRFSLLAFDFQATFSAPWTILFGPSGCGKSTLLSALCGLTPDLSVQCSRQELSAQGWLTLQDDRSTVPPQNRRMAYAPQQAGLFPHLSVLENIAFSQALRRSAAAVTPSPTELLNLLGLQPLATRLPRQLSGGERQRVSLARALAVPDARLVLLDESFAGVDRALRDQLLPRIQQHLAGRGIPAISVTHDVDETFLLQAEVIRLHDGRNAAQGPAKTILATEAHAILRTFQQTGI